MDGMSTEHSRSFDDHKHGPPRSIRTMAALLIGIRILNGTLSGLTAIAPAAIAVVFLLTSLVRFCPL